jgi:hypothetical protein
MPILPILRIHIFSDSYEITDFSGVQKVTNVVKKYVKKWSMGRKKGFRCQITDDRSQMTENRNSLPFVFFHLFSVLCPLLLPDT